MSVPVHSNLDLNEYQLENAVIHKLTTTNKNALTPSEGQLVYDDTLNRLEVYDGSAWQPTGEVLTAGDGLTKTGTTLAVGGGSGLTANADDLAVNVGAGLEISSDAVRIAAAAAGAGLAGGAGSALAVGAGTGITVNADDVAVDTSVIATKAYADSVAQGLDSKASVRAATTAAVTLASAFENGDSLDGVTLATGDRVLVKNQADPIENGIYTVNASGAPTRAADANAEGELSEGSFVFVEEGTTNEATGWVLSEHDTASWTPGTDGSTWTQFSGAGLITAGAGLTKSGNTLDVGAGTGITVNADDIAINTSVVPRLGSANTFTQPITVDLGATGTALTLDIHTGGAEKWLKFTEGATELGSFSEFLDALRLTATNTMSIIAGSGVGISSGGGADVTLAPDGDVSVSSKRIKSVADASAATDALNRQTGDSRYARKATFNVGNGTDTSIALTHNLGTRDVSVKVYLNGSPYKEILVDAEHTDTNTVTLQFGGVIPTSAQYRAVVHA